MTIVARLLVIDSIKGSEVPISLDYVAMYSTYIFRKSKVECSHKLKADPFI